MLDHIHDPLGTKITPDMRDAARLEKKACDDLANEDLSCLPDSAFAYAIEFGDRYYPCHTPGHLALSRAYLHGHPEGLSKKEFDAVSSYLEDAAAAFGLPPWEQCAMGKPEDPPDESRQLADDMFDFERNYRRMYIDSRRRIANSLFARAEALGRAASLPGIVVRYSRRHLRPDYMRAIEDRRGRFAEGSPMRDELLGIGMGARAMGAGALLSALKRFDEENGLTAHYDDDLLDPYLGLLGDGPAPPASVYRDGDREVFEDDVEPGRLKGVLKDLIDDKLIQALCLNFANAMDRLRPEMKTVVMRAVARPRARP